MNINKATIVGRLVRDPEQKALPNGTAVVNCSIATSRTWKDQNGQKQEDAEFDPNGYEFPESEYFWKMADAYGYEKAKDEAIKGLQKRLAAKLCTGGGGTERDKTK